MSITTEVTAKPQEWLTYLTGDDTIAKLNKQIAANIDPNHLVRVVYGAMTRQPKLFECTKTSIMFCVAECARLGLEPALGRAWFVPYWNGKTKKTDCQLIIGYQGLCDLARRSGEITSIEAHAVFENDEFEIKLGTKTEVKHVPKIPKTKDETRGNAYVFYCVAHFKDGGFHFEYMTMGEIEAIRQRSKAANAGPWVTDFIEMSKKSVVRRAAKYMPLSISDHRFADALQMSDAIDCNNLLDVEAVPADNNAPQTAEQIAEGAFFDEQNGQRDFSDISDVRDLDGVRAEKLQTQAPVMQQAQAPKPQTKDNDLLAETRLETSLFDEVKQRISKASALNEFKKIEKSLEEYEETGELVTEELLELRKEIAKRLNKK
jgi:phage RecT family recombinase